MSVRDSILINMNMKHLNMLPSLTSLFLRHLLDFVAFVLIIVIDKLLAMRNERPGKVCDALTG